MGALLIAAYFCIFIENSSLTVMKKIFNATYRKDYLEGYAAGLNPFLSLKTKMNKATVAGFKSGRMDYEDRNGRVSNGIPKRIITEKVLEDFLLAGMFGFDIDIEGYTTFQINTISKWYQSGTEKYDPNQFANLSSLLNDQKIAMPI